MGNVPNLRFPEFSGKWKKCTLGDITINFNLRNKEKIELPMYSVTNNRGFIPQSEQFEDRDMVGEDIKAYKIIHNKDFAYNPARINVGSIAKYNGSKPCMISSLYVCFKAANGIDEDWLMHLLRSPKIQYYYNINGEGGVRIYLFYPNFARIRTSFPTIAEQRKIANLLSLLDARITTQNKIIEDLKKLKSAIIHCCYSSKTDMVSLSELLKQCSERNRSATDLQVLSVNNKYGFIAQSDQFEDREVASDDTTNYKVVEKGMFAYNPARINVGSIALYEMDGKGIVSPMYVCFTTKRTLLPGYLKHYFASQTFRHEMFKRLEGSVRLCLTFDSLCNIEIPLPSIELQENVGKYLSTIERKISLEESMLSQYQLQRSYLLSQMFI
ncbi:restriction endonuclease subunit S [Paraprevotella clara]|uniref:restriction endonuclease subunit S n=1 Tax=Paraprevotella clara TaxID=454154 RepID=UPI002490C1EF|nr:restriction endonuclease subunit S [Paraprevotella clara]BDI76084.1 restriction endonuclease subunit S [Paraprevotella clara]